MNSTLKTKIELTEREKIIIKRAYEIGFKNGYKKAKEDCLDERLITLEQAALQQESNDPVKPVATNLNIENYKAGAKNWAEVEEYALSDPKGSWDPCLLELRCRVEKLESK